MFKSARPGVCALSLGLLRLVPSWAGLDNRRFEAILIGAGFALMALVAAWVALGRGHWSFKLLALPVVTLLVGGLLIAIEPRHQRTDLGVMALVFGQMLFLAGSLTVLRRCGYRLARHRRK